MSREKGEEGCGRAEDGNDTRYSTVVCGMKEMVGPLLHCPRRQGDKEPVAAGGRERMQQRWRVAE